MSPRIRSIIANVATVRGLTLADLIGPARHREVAYARFEAMAKLRQLRNHRGGHQFSLPQIGRAFDRDHTTALASIRRAETMWGVFPPIYPMSGDIEETRL